MTWMTDVGPRGKPSGTPIPPLFIMAAPAQPHRAHPGARARPPRGARAAGRSGPAGGRSTGALDCSQKNSRRNGRPLPAGPPARPRRGDRSLPREPLPREPPHMQPAGPPCAGRDRRGPGPAQEEARAVRGRPRRRRLRAHGGRSSRAPGQGPPWRPRRRLRPFRGEAPGNRGISRLTARLVAKFSERQLNYPRE